MLKAFQRRMEKIKLNLGLSIYQKSEHVKDLPRHIQIEPTVRCNLHCITCSRDSVIGSYNKKDLTVEEVERIVAQFPDLRSVKLQGLGETFLHPQVEEILNIFKKRNIKVWIISNGTFFLKENVRRLILQYVTDITVSFDAVEGKMFNYLRKGADLARIKEGIKLLVDERNKSNADTLIGLNYVISSENYLQLEQLSQVAVDLKVDYVVLVDVENWTVPGEDGFQASADFVAETRKHAAKINQAIRKVFWSLLFKGVMVFHKSSAKRLGRCHWPFKSMFVSVEGLVTPCCIRMHRGHALGNIFEKGSLDEIWNSEQYKALRRNHMCQKGPDTICAQCPN